MSTADSDSVSDSGGRIRVRGRDGVEVEWSRKAARKAITLRHMIEDTSTSGEFQHSTQHSLPLVHRGT